MLLAVASVVVACGKKTEEGTTPATDTAKDPVVKAPPPIPTPDKGKIVMEASCASCHEIEKVTDARMSRDDWEAQVEMCTGGSPLSEGDAEVLLDFLAKSYGSD
jgi:cytochrome c5